MNKTIIKERPINNVFNWRNNNYLVKKDEPLEENCNKCAFKIACYNTFVKTCYNTNRLSDPLQRMHCNSKTRRDNTSIHYVKIT